MYSVCEAGPSLYTAVLISGLWILINTMLPSPLLGSLSIVFSLPSVPLLIVPLIVLTRPCLLMVPSALSVLPRVLLTSLVWVSFFLLSSDRCVSPHRPGWVCIRQKAVLRST